MLMTCDIWNYTHKVCNLFARVLWLSALLNYRCFTKYQRDMPSLMMNIQTRMSIKKLNVVWPWTYAATCGRCLRWT